MAPERVEAISSNLRQLLLSYSVNLELWGKGEAKTFDHFLREVLEGEVNLLEKAGELVRRVKGVSINVVYQDGRGNIYRLREEKQVFRDGRTKVRERNSERAVSEKIKQAESPENAAGRAIQEELGIEGDVALIKEDTLIEPIRDSISFPGLKTEHTVFQFMAVLDRNQFDPRGYKEEQPDKTTYFVWRKLPTRS